jgi:hypothetical protein
MTPWRFEGVPFLPNYRENGCGRVIWPAAAAKSQAGVKLTAQAPPIQR